MKTMRDYSKELAKLIKNGEEKEFISPNLIEASLEGHPKAMVQVGGACLREAAHNSSSDLERKKKLAELGIFWCNETIQHGGYDKSSDEQGFVDWEDTMAPTWVALAYNELAAVYHNVLTKGEYDYYENLSDVIPENKQKAFHYRLAGANYSELCATEMVVALIDGELVGANLWEAYVRLMEVFEQTKNTPRNGWCNRSPKFDNYYSDYEVYNQIALRFYREKAFFYAFETWDRIHEIKEKELSGEFLDENEKKYGYRLDPKRNDVWKITYNLAFCYVSGVGTSADLEKASMYFYRAKTIYEAGNHEKPFLEMDKKNYNLAKRLGIE